MIDRASPAAWTLLQRWFGWDGSGPLPESLRRLEAPLRLDRPDAWLTVQRAEPRGGALLLDEHRCLPDLTRVQMLGLGREQAMILVAMGRGLSEAQIAQEMFLSESAVRAYAVGACNRVGAATPAEALAKLLTG